MIALSRSNDREEPTRLGATTYEQGPAERRWLRRPGWAAAAVQSHRYILSCLSEPRPGGDIPSPSPEIDWTGSLSDVKPIANCVCVCVYLSQ